MAQFRRDLKLHITKTCVRKRQTKDGEIVVGVQRFRSHLVYENTKTS